MCIMCQRASAEWSNLYKQGLIKIDTFESLEQSASQLTPAIPETETVPEQMVFTTGPNDAPTAIFNVDFTKGEYYVGKEISLVYSIEDPQGFDPSAVNVRWFEVTESSTAGSYFFGADVGNVTETPNGTTFVIDQSLVNKQIAVEISYTDDLGNSESFWTLPAGIITSVASYTVNAERSVVLYDDFASYLTSNGFADHEPKVKILAESFQGKWGGALGTAPTELTYSISGPGEIDYSAQQIADHTMYGDIDQYSGTVAALGAQQFSNEEIADIEDALSDWTNITGISFVERTDLGSNADIVFTKLDFQEWHTTVYNDADNAYIQAGSAGFAFTPHLSSDFIVGDVFLNSNLSARNLDKTVYSLGSEFGLSPDTYVLRGDDLTGYHAYHVAFDSSTNRYGMTDPDTAASLSVLFPTKEAIYTENLTIAGYLPSGQSVKGVASHEIGHALGLAHPHDGHFITGDAVSGHLPNYHTVMSYDSEGFYSVDSPMMYDYWAMTGLYGVSQTSNGDDTYTYYVDSFVKQPAQAGVYYREMLHDVGGVDTVKLTSQINQGVYFNLNKGSFSDFQSKPTGDMSAYMDTDDEIHDYANFQVSDFTEIENLVATNGDDIVDATVDWAVNVDLSAGDDIVHTNGNGGIFDGGDGTADKIIISVTDVSDYYVEAQSVSEGRLVNKSDDVAFCTVEDFETIELIDTVTGSNVYSSWLALQDLLPPTPTDPIDVTYGDGGATLTIIINDTSITTQGEAEAAIWVDGSALTGGTFAAAVTSGTTTAPATYVITGATAGTYSTSTEVTFDVDGSGDINTGDFVDNATEDTSGNNNPPVASSDYDKDVFEIVRVGLDEGPNGSGGRFGKIETFGIRLMDDGIGTTTDDHTFTNVDLVIEWEQGEYMFWGNYQPGTGTPTEDSESFTNSLVLDDISTITQNPLATELNLSFFDSSSVTYAEGDYLATFMMERLDTSGAVENFITLDTSRYNYDSDATVDDPFPLTRSPDPVDFDFGYAAHDVDIKLANARAVEAHNPKLFVSNGSISDGLSIVPVAKLGHFVKYEVVLNISRPTFIDTGASVASAQAIEIYGAQIFEESVLDLTGLATGQTAETLGTNKTVTIHDGDSVTAGTAVASTTITADANLKGHEFFEIAGRALDPEDTGYTEADLGSVDSLYLSFTDLTKPTSVAADGSDAEGRYVMAEFVAYSSDGPDIMFKSGKEIESQMVFGDPIEITHRGGPSDATAAANPTTIVGGDYDGDYTTYWTESVADGSDIALLGEGFYENPETYEDAIGAEDALAALIIANDSAGDTYDQSQIIAADFNESGDVNSADAYDILHYAVFGAQDGGAIPKWVYIDDIESGTSTGGVSSSVDYDPNIDLFVGGSVEIDATAVLIGDVSESYESLGEHAPINEYMWYFESFMHREYVTIDASGQTPILEDADGMTYDNVDANGGTNAAGDLVALDYVPEWFTLVGDSTVGTPVVMTDIEWGFGNDVVILSLDTPDNYDRVKLDLADTAIDTPAEIAEDFFEAGFMNALMLDTHDGETPTGEQILIVDSNMDGALGDTDFMMVFQGVDKNAFDDEYSIIYDGAIA